MTKNRIYTLLTLFIIALSLCAQSPKHEMRSSWVATAWNLNWPNTTVTDPSNKALIGIQQRELTRILDSLQSANMNAIFFQIRPMSDALYQSSYEPWSEYLTGTRGRYPGYDPLAFAIEEAHKRGLELHAWINPYRYSSSIYSYGTLPNDYSNTHPEWILDYGDGKAILDPGNPQVVVRIKEIVAEVVANYDIDGVVFDDYFYVSGTSSKDSVSQRLYNTTNLPVNDWRRENVNRMVAEVHDTIHSLKPYCRFGISPAGVAASDADVAAKYGVEPCPGSDWQYNDICSDPLAWVSSRTVDYISPQIYWTIGSFSDYGKIAPWWSMVADKFGRHFYSSHSLSDMSYNAPPRFGRSNMEESILRTVASFDKTEVGAQVKINRESDLVGAPGSVFYNNNKLMFTPGFINYLKTKVFTRKALVPAFNWKGGAILDIAKNITLSNDTLTWSAVEGAKNYVIYAFPDSLNNEVSVLNSSKHIVCITYDTSYVFVEGIDETQYSIVIRPIDMYGMEFAPAYLNQSQSTSGVANLLYPANATTIASPMIMKWSEARGAYGYIVQISSDSAFTDILACKQIPDTTIYSEDLLDFSNLETYYWRVMPICANAMPVWSTSNEFTTKQFRILSPVDGSDSLSLALTIEWEVMGETQNYFVEIADDMKFNRFSLIHQDTVQASQVDLPASILMPSTEYFVRVSTYIGQNKAYTDVISFTTESIEVSRPIILSPVMNDTIIGSDVVVEIQEQVSKGFRIEMSESSSFPPRNTRIKTIDAFDYTHTFDDVEPATYYLRVFAVTDEGKTESSEVVKFVVEETTGLDTPNADKFVQIVHDGVQKCIIIQDSSLLGAKFEILSITGEVLSNGILAKNHQKIDSNHLSEGIYILKINNSTDMYSVKFIK